MKSYKKQLLHLTAGLTVSYFALGTAMAQETSTDAQGQQSKRIDDENVIVVEGVRQQVIDALSQKREAKGFVDAIGAEDLGRFPDLNLGEALQRLSGVTLSRSDNGGNAGAVGEGDGAQINLRGLGAEFTRVEINGASGTSSFNSAFDFNILASELFSNVKVYKTASARQVEGGLAGLVELETPSAFDRDGLTVVGSATAQYGEAGGRVEPRFSFLLSQNWGDKVGVTASASYNKFFVQTDAAGGISARALSASGTAALAGNATQAELDALIPTTINYEVEQNVRETLGLSLGLQFRPSDTLEFKLDGIYSRLDSDSVFTRADAPPESGIFDVSNTTIQNGVLTSATLDDVQNRIAVFDNSRVEDLIIVSGEAKFTPDDYWTIIPYVGYSKRDRAFTDSLLSFARGARDATGALTGQLGRFPVSYNLNNQFIEFTSGGAFDQTVDPNEFLLNIFLYQPAIDRDQEFSTKLDITREFDDSPLKRIDFGGRYSDREISRSRSFFIIDNDQATSLDLTTLPTLGNFSNLVGFNISGAPASFPNMLLTGDPQAITAAFLTSGFDTTRPEKVVAGDVSTTTTESRTIPGTIFLDLRANGAAQEIRGAEETFALYAETTFEWDDVLLNAGVRYIDTKTNSSGFQIINDIAIPVSISNSYNKILPSIGLRYSVANNINLRAVYSKTLTRPTLFDSRVSERFIGTDESGGAGGSRGNPNLLPSTSNNIDVGAEFYFGEEGLVSLTYFNKSISGLITTTTVTEQRTFRSQVTGLDVTAPILFVIPGNSEKTVSIEGLEANIQGRFTFMPDGFLQNFGGIFNYTYVSSAAAFQNESDQLQGTGLPGLSNNSFNAVLYYDDGRLDGRLSYAWRDGFLNLLNDNFGIPSFAQPRGQLDLSMNYKVKDYLTLQIQALNLTRSRFDIESVRNVAHTAAQFDRQWFIGARFSF